MGIYLSAPNKEKEIVEGQSNDQWIRYISAGMQGWRVQMEDAHIATTNVAGKDIHVFGIFDGHGGKEVAKFCEKHFIEEMVADPEFRTGNYQAVLRRTFMKMDELLETETGKKELKVLKGDAGDEFGGDKLESFAGCTANVVLIVGQDLYVANAGDSRAALFRAGKAIELSSDHKPDLETESRRILRAGGTINDGRINGNLNLSRAIGDLEYKRNEKFSKEEQLIISLPDIRKERLGQTDQFILMGCDGIWESNTPQELLEKVDSKIKKYGLGNLNKVVDELLNELLAPDTSTGIGCDNMSCTLIVLKSKL